MLTTLSIAAFAVVVLVAAYWWSRRQSHVVEDPEIMRIRATLAPRMHAAYVRHRAKLLDIIKEPLVVDTEESLFSESVVWRRQFRANPTSENKEKHKFNFNNLKQLHADLELDHPELKELNERIGNVREAIFILEHGTPQEIRKLLGDAKALGWDFK
jgi:hypothetical protein